jgi:hypothetical protein
VRLAPKVIGRVFTADYARNLDKAIPALDSTLGRMNRDGGGAPSHGPPMEWVDTPMWAY